MSEKERPNILILMPDQMRADCMGCAGHTQIRTPNLDQLSADGVRFTNTFTVSPICMPARASFANGLYPHNHGMWTNLGRMPSEDETFYHLLQRIGYHTAHIGKSHYYPTVRRDHMKCEESYMHTRGFEYAHDTPGPMASIRMESFMSDEWKVKGLYESFRKDYEERRRLPPWTSRISPLPTGDFPDSYVGRKAVEFVKGYKDERPMCLFVGFPGPHDPWDAPGEYATMYDSEETPPPIKAGEPGEWVPPKAADMMLLDRYNEMSIGDVRKVRANYYGKISLIDYWIGQILEAFEDRGWLDDLFAIFWSDHGEMLGDHQRLHKFVFYESSLRVPLTIRWPGHIPNSRTTDALVEIIDVFPTVLEAVGAAQSERCLGKSLWPIIRDPSVVNRQTILSEIHYGGCRRFMIRNDRYKYATSEMDGGYLLHDLEKDPTEYVNLIGHPDQQENETRLSNELLHLLMKGQYTLREGKLSDRFYLDYKFKLS